jgi:Rps23 Pro-64 3,4-dihydroxylase Tpa1-like proline 4-hydroxylase
MYTPFKISSEEYQTKKPYPYMLQDGFLDESFAKALQAEILRLPDTEWDRYENPFEQKFTLRNKYTFPENLTKLFDIFQSDEFINNLSKIVGYSLKLDTTRNFWGVHKYDKGDKLDIHVDAGLHPTLKLKKQVTLGLYLSYNWKDTYGCELEVWKGDNASLSHAAIYEKMDSIAPLFNRLIMFTCNDYAWHGNPEPVNGPDDAKRIFVTISYLSDNCEDLNKKVKAFFVKRPQDPVDVEKDKLRFLRADPEKYKEIYRV